MAIKGLAVPVMADYRYDGNKVIYEKGFVCGKAVEYGVEVETSDDNHLYGDDMIAEHDYGTFNSGTLTLNTTDLDQYTSMRLLNLKEVQVEVGEKQVKELVHDDDTKPTPKGFGIIETHQIDDKDQYRAVILTKITPKIPAEAATTKGESIEWQTKEIGCGIERSDEVSENYNHPWQREAWFKNQEEAMDYLKTVLNAMEQVEAVSEEGTEVGKTKITIKNQVLGAAYKYSTAGPEPTYKQDLTSWTELNMGEEIEAEDGTVLFIARVDTSNKAIGAGSVTVVAKKGE